MTVGRTCSHQGLRERKLLNRYKLSIRASKRGSKSEQNSKSHPLLESFLESLRTFFEKKVLKKKAII